VGDQPPGPVKHEVGRRHAFTAATAGSTRKPSLQEYAPSLTKTTTLKIYRD